MFMLKVGFIFWSLLFPMVTTQSDGLDVCFNSGCTIQKRTKQFISPCPQGFHIEEATNICWTVIKNTTYPPNCPYKGIVPFDEYINVVSSTFLPVWMPVQKKLSKYGYEPFVWTEITENYGQMFVHNYTYEGKLIDKNCMVYNSTQDRVAVDCDSHYNGVCAYKYRPRSFTNCKITYGPVCQNIDYPLDSKCVCVDLSRENSFNKSEFLLPHQNYNYLDLTRDTCLMALEERDGIYYWSNSNLRINYTLWSPNLNESNNVGAASQDGWVLLETEESTNCSLVEKEVNINPPTLSLSLVDENLTLNIENYKSLYFISDTEPLVRCFTDTGPDQLFKIQEMAIKVLFGDSITYIHSIQSNLPGHYICQAFQSNNLELITSNEILDTKNGSYCELVSEFTDDYSKTLNPFSFVDGLLEKYELLLRHKCKNLCIPRLFKINTIDEEKCEITHTMHISIKSVNQSKCLEFYNNLNQNDMAVRIADICIGQAIKINDQTLILPTVKIDATAEVIDYCFTKSGQKLSLKCEGNFIDAAKFDTPTDTCEKFDNTTHTEALKNMIENDEVDMEQVLTISSCDDLNELDVYYLTGILEYVANSRTYPKIILEIIDKIVNKPKSILKKSQVFFNTSDTLVNVMKNNTNIEYDGEHFKVIGLKDRGFYMDLNRRIYMIKSDVNIHDLRTNKSIHSAFIWDRKFWKELNGHSVLISIFYTDNLFCGRYHMVITSDVVLGVSVTPKPRSELKYNVIFNKDLYNDCIYYKTSTDYEYKGYWTSNGNNNAYSTGCIYNLEGYIAVADVSSCVTQNLNEIFNSNDTVPVKLNSVNEICSNFNSHFQPIDINFISQILELAALSDMYDLKLTSEIVNNLLDVNEDVMKESQIQYNATDRILYFVDAIVVKAKNSDTIKKDKFSVFTADLREMNISGVAIQNCDESCEIFPIFNPTIDDLNNIDAAVILDEALKEQLLNNQNDSYVPQLVVTIYYNNVLFVDPRNTTMIFGVLLPNFNEEFKGNVSVVYNQSGSIKDVCAFWDYKLKSYPGSWKKESPKRQKYDFSICEYSHLTHFAMLIFDSEFNDKYHLLDVITTVCCSLSGVGILGILITGLLFKKWRKNTGNHILINFVIAISLKIILLYVSNSVYENMHGKSECVVLGAMLHYSLLSEFCWMLIIAILQFKRFVEVLGGPPKYILLKAYVCGWLLPLIPVVCILAIDPDNYVSGNGGLCYPSHLGLYLGVWLPILIILLINIVIFYFIMYNVCYQKTECREMVNHESLFQWRLALLLFFMLGLTWSFGLIAQINGLGIFVYLFTITATLQGFIMFLFFILFNKSTRKLYTNTLKQLKYSNSQFSNN